MSVGAVGEKRARRTQSRRAAAERDASEEDEAVIPTLFGGFVRVPLHGVTERKEAERRSGSRGDAAAAARSTSCSTTTGCMLARTLVARPGVPRAARRRGRVPRRGVFDLKPSE